MKTKVGPDLDWYRPWRQSSLSDIAVRLGRGRLHGAFDAAWTVGDVDAGEL